MPPALQHHDLLNPAELSKVGHLELLSRRIVDGYLSGRHRSRSKGGCVEFDEHRLYSPGDELRLIDWRVLARTDRAYIKQFEEQVSLQSTLVIDASGSMGFGHSTLSKFDYARVCAACLARLILRQTDSAGLALIGEGIESYVPPRSTAHHLQALLSQLTVASTAGETSLANALNELAQRSRRRGLILIFSDCFDDVASFSKALKLLRARGHETLLFHIMAPEELRFEFDQWSRFECLEVDGRRVDLEPAEIRDDYLGEIRDFLRRLKRVCGDAGCDYFPMTTDMPLCDTLTRYLRLRMARIKKTG